MVNRLFILSRAEFFWAFRHRLINISNGWTGGELRINIPMTFRTVIITQTCMAKISYSIVILKEQLQIKMRFNLPT